MKISEAIEKIKAYHKGTINGQPIDPAKTRDKILWGNPDQELTGVVVTCYASVEVVKEALRLGANLIVPHEALFWNHGDHTDWLADNETFKDKSALLDQGGIVVWRDHDYIHSGIPLEDGTWTDGIFYGLMKELGWDAYLIDDVSRPLKFSIPRTTAGELGRDLMEKFDLRGMKVIGDPASPSEKAWVCGHIDGRQDNQILKITEEEGIDTLITLECTDYTVAEYVRDSTMLGHPKTILAMGHFNTEEPGMKYMASWLPAVLGGEVPVTFVPCTDMYHFLHK